MKKLQPELRFKEFSGDWEEKKYEDIYSFYSTNSLSREKLNYNEGIIKNIHYGDIHTKFSTMFDIKEEKVPFINMDVDLSKVKEESFCQVGDLVIADASEDYTDIGKTIEILSLGGFRTLAGLHTFLARPDKEKLYTGFVGNLLKSWKIRKQVMTIAQGSKILSLSTTRLSKVKLNIPSLPEQEKVALFLSSVDEKIEKLEGKKEKLGEYKKGIMQEIFSQEIRFKDENGECFPDWEEKKLGEVAKIYDGTHQTPKYVESGIPFYSVEHVTANQFIKTKFVTKEVFEKENKRVKLEYGDILMTRIGSIGKAKYINWDVNASFYVSLALIKQNNTYNGKYMNQLINSDYFQSELWKKTIHVAFPKKINLGDLGQCKGIFPCLEEQEKIAKFLSSVDEKIDKVRGEIDRMKEFKKGLLQGMFV